MKLYCLIYFTVITLLKHIIIKTYNVIIFSNFNVCKILNNNSSEHLYWVYLLVK